MIIAGATIGAVSFGIQVYNSWRNEKNAKAIQASQEAYQRAAMEQNFQVAMEQFRAMSEARKQIIGEEHQERTALMQEMHQQNLRMIAELSSLDKWPLAVMPLVMRDDNLFGNMTDDTESIVPINVIMGPCRDKNFQSSIWKSVEDELSIRFTKSWNNASRHPILFYQDAWKDEKDPADSAQCANIHASTQNVPTIIFSPVMTRRGLQIEMTHWCITGMDANKSYCREVRLSLDGVSHQYQQHDNYDDVDKEQLVAELVDMLESIIGYMDDQYMWCRYNVVPLLPQMIVLRYDVALETIASMYEQYVAMLESSLSNSQLQIAMDLDAVLTYCAVIDQFGQSNKAFNVVCKEFLGENTLADPKNGLPSYEIEKLVMFLRYIKRHQASLSVTKEFVDSLHYSISVESLYRKCVENLHEDGRIFSRNEAHRFIMEEPFVDAAKELLASESLEICDNLIERCRHETDENTDRRNWLRPMFKEQVFEAFERKVAEILIEIGNSSRLYKDRTIEEMLSHSFGIQQQDELLRLELENEIQEAIEQCRERLTEYIHSKGTTVSTDFWKESYIKESVEKRVLEYCNTSLTKWIDYIMFREDIIRESIPEAAQELIASRMNDLCQMLEKIADDYIIMNYPPQIQ